MVDEFNENGFVVLRGVISTHILHELEAQCELISSFYMDKYESSLNIKKIIKSDYCYDMLKFFNENKKYCPRANRKELDLHVVKNIFYQDDIYNVAQAVMGQSDLKLYQEYSLRSVAPHSYFENITGWHQDAPDTGVKLQMLGVWLPITESKTGGLDVIKASHLYGCVEHTKQPPFYHILDPIIEKNLNNKLSLDLEPGDCLLFHHHLFHTAQLNESDKLRWSLDFRYQTSEQFNRLNVGHDLNKL